jgi:GTPase SAR1 family protein
LTCDITEENSFIGLKSWIEVIEDKGPERVGLCIFANKIDLEDERQVSEKQVKDLAESISAQWQEVSAYNNVGLEVR